MIRLGINPKYVSEFRADNIIAYNLRIGGLVRLGIQTKHVSLGYDMPANYNTYNNAFLGAGEYTRHDGLQTLVNSLADTVFWLAGIPPTNYPDWETEDADGNKIVNMEAIRRDLAKNPMRIYFDKERDTNVKKLSDLLNKIALEPSKIKKRTGNLFDDRTASGYSKPNKFVKQDNGFLATAWATPYYNTDELCKVFKVGKSYNFSFDMEILDIPDGTKNTQPWGFCIYNSANALTVVSFRRDITEADIYVGNKIHCSFSRTIKKDIANSVLYCYGGLTSRGAITTRFSNIMLTEGTEEVDYVPYMSEVKTIAWGVKPECKLILNGSEQWAQYVSGTTWIGAKCGKTTNAHTLREAQYNNYWGFQYFGNMSKFLWIQPDTIFIAWSPGSPPFASWETTDANGKAIANIPQIKADLAKRNLVVYYDNTNSRPKTLAQLLKIVRREVYNNFSATIDSNILTLTNSSVENNVLILPDDKTVTNNVLNL